METPRNFNLIPLKNPWNAVTSVLIADFTLCLILSFSSKNRLMEPCRFSGCEQLKQTVKSQHHFGIPQTVCDPAVCPADSRAARGSAGGAAAGTQSRNSEIKDEGGHLLSLGCLDENLSRKQQPPSEESKMHFFLFLFLFCSCQSSSCFSSCWSVSSLNSPWATVAFSLSFQWATAHYEATFKIHKYIIYNIYILQWLTYTLIEGEEPLWEVSVLWLEENKFTRFPYCFLSLEVMSLFF